MVQAKVTVAPSTKPCCPACSCARVQGVPDAEKVGDAAWTVKTPDVDGVLASLPALRAIACSGKPVTDTVTAPEYWGESCVGADPSVVK